MVGETEEDAPKPVRAIVDEVPARWSTNGRVRVGLHDFTSYTSKREQVRNFAPAWLASLEDTVVATASNALRAEGMVPPSGTTYSAPMALPRPVNLDSATIGCGPGEQDQAYTADESIAVNDLHTGAPAAITSSLLESTTIP
ncbi:hypothetical protein [Arthrobacter sp. efr-133-TYG-118]|uniref:hypothetical protein n=1 Tax=Arthrobacter sp. efr-133-TYG-118 TaxID=3040279 RepID=UPI002551ADAD|nr:hypothetical protein [Arthrobacter sp. efr-133-TYG-118]